MAAATRRPALAADGHHDVRNSGVADSPLDNLLPRMLTQFSTGRYQIDRDPTVSGTEHTCRYAHHAGPVITNADGAN